MIVLILIILILIVITYNVCNNESFSNLIYAKVPLNYFNDTTSNSFNYLEYKDNNINVPNAQAYTNKNLYTVL